MTTTRRLSAAQFKELFQKELANWQADLSVNPGVTVATASEKPAKKYIGSASVRGPE